MIPFEPACCVVIGDRGSWSSGVDLSASLAVHVCRCVKVAAAGEDLIEEEVSFPEQKKKLKELLMDFCTPEIGLSAVRRKEVKCRILIFLLFNLMVNPNII